MLACARQRRSRRRGRDDQVCTPPMSTFGRHRRRQFQFAALDNAHCLISNQTHFLHVRSLRHSLLLARRYAAKTTCIPLAYSLRSQFPVRGTEESCTLQ
jgi:hypothetical protein